MREHAEEIVVIGVALMVLTLIGGLTFTFHEPKEQPSRAVMSVSVEGGTLEMEGTYHIKLNSRR